MVGDLRAWRRSVKRTELIRTQIVKFRLLGEFQIIVPRRDAKR